MTARETETLKKEIVTLTESWKRALADYQNLQKRYDRERADFVQFASAGLILRLIEVLNHLEKAAENLKDKGLDIIVTEFKKVLTENGLEEIKSQGEKFDPNFMEAVEVVEGKDEGKVAEVVSKGYLLNGKVLLPAKVKVFQAEKPEEKAENLAQEQLLKGDYM